MVSESRDRSSALSKNSPKQLISREAIRAGYRQGEEAVIALVEGLLENLEQLETRVMELEGRLSKNSRNSSQPPSDDGFGKQTKSLRTQSERKAGGQPEHSGQTLEWSSDVEQVVEQRVAQCEGCGGLLAQEPVKAVYARQVHDIPPVVLKVTEHQAEVKGCPHCGLENQAAFPAEAKSVVQYGARLKSMMVYLMEG